MQPSIEIQGLDQLEKNLLELGADLGSKVLRGALMDAATPLLDEIKEQSPVKTGALFRSLGKRSKVNRTGRAESAVVVRVGAVGRKNAWQAKFHEFGTSNQKAQPFIRPAADKAPEAVAIFKGRLKRKIELAARRLARQKARAK